MISPKNAKLLGMDRLSLREANKLISEYNKMKPKARIQWRKRRLYEVVTYAKEHSAYYASLYADLPANFTINDIPTTDREALTADYSAWSTDSEVSLESIYQYMDEHQGDGVLYLDRYHVVSSSGTDAAPMLSLYDEYMAQLLSVISLRRSLARREHFWISLKRGMRLASIYSTSGPFYHNMFAEMRRSHIPTRAKKSILLQAQSPTSKLVSTLNEFQPALLAGFPSVLSRMADEHKASRLKVNPVCIMANGEELTDEIRHKLESVFKCDVTSSYSSVEGGAIAYECREHHLHLNDDWVIVEPVDADGNPAREGEVCDHVLLTNLMNYTTPIIRYALEDKLIVHNTPCLCGNCSPWIEIVGRSVDQVVVDDGVHETELPMEGLSEVLKGVAEIKRYQILVYPGNVFSLRLSPTKGVDKTMAYFKAEKLMRDYLKSQGIVSSAITLEKEDPKPDPLSGKYLTVITN